MFHVRFPRRALLAFATALVCLAPGVPAPAASDPFPDPGAGSLRVHEARDAGSAAMTPQDSIWFNRLLAGMDGSATLIDNTMLTGDLYSIGRDGGNYIEALLMALRATGDRRFLDRVLALTQLAKPLLRDAWLDGTTDGYTDWLWLADPTNPTFYGKDTDWLDESITSGNVALWTYAFNANRSLDTAYASAADFWRNWLEHEFLAKWYSRAGGDTLGAWDTPYLAFYKPDTEPRSANWRLAHYLWRLTGNPFYRAREDEIVNELMGSQVVNSAHPSAYRWAQQTDPSSQSWQLVNYANYYVRVVMEMNLEGVPYFASAPTMRHFAATFRDVVYAASLPGLTTMTNDVNGGGSTSYAPYAFNGLSPWDSTGFLMNLANRSITGAGNYAPGGLSKAARNDVFISAYALMALMVVGQVPAAVEPPAPPRASLALESLEPNPFTGSVRVRLALPTAARVRVGVYDVGGRLVRLLGDGERPAGLQLLAWDGRDEQARSVPGGMYFVVAESAGQRAVGRVVRLR